METCFFGDTTSCLSKSSAVHSKVGREQKQKSKEVQAFVELHCPSRAKVPSSKRHPSLSGTVTVTVTRAGSLAFRSSTTPLAVQAGTELSIN